MNVTIHMIEDRGFSKKLHFSTANSNDVLGYINVDEMHPWFNKQVDDELTLSDHI
jgi:hypothetical protein